MSLLNSFLLYWGFFNRGSWNGFTGCLRTMRGWITLLRCYKDMFSNAYNSLQYLFAFIPERKAQQKHSLGLYCLSESTCRIVCFLFWDVFSLLWNCWLNSKVSFIVQVVQGLPVAPRFTCVQHTPNAGALPCCWRGKGCDCDWLLCCSCRNWSDRFPSRPKACGVKARTISSRGLIAMWSCRWTWCLRWARAPGSSPAPRARHPPRPESSSCQKTTRLTSSRSTSSRSPPSATSATTWLSVRSDRC